MRVSVVIPVAELKEGIGELLKSLEGSEDLDYEVILVTPRLPTALNLRNVKIVRDEGKGPGAARNRGVEVAKGDIIAFTDSDCIVSKGWLKLLIEEFDSEEVGIVAGPTLARDLRSFLSKYLELSVITPFPKYDRKIIMEGDFKPLTFITTSNLAIRKEVFKLVGGFDESYRHYGSEDMDLAYRVLKAGYKIAYSPRPLVYHSHRHKLSAILKRYYEYGVGFAKFFLKHPGSVFSKLAMGGMISLIVLLLLSSFLLFTPWKLLGAALTLLPYLGISSFHLLRGESRKLALVYALLDLLLIWVSIIGTLRGILSYLKAKLT